MLDAVAVLHADVVSYERDPDKARNAMFRLKPIDVWKGDISDHLNQDGVLTISWRHHQRTPQRIQQRRLIFALGEAKSFLLNDEVVFMTDPDYLTVLDSCGGPPHVYVPRNGLAERIEGILKSETPVADADELHQDLCVLSFASFLTVHPK